MIKWVLHKEYDNSGKITCEMMDFISFHHTIFITETVLDLMLDSLSELGQSPKHSIHFIEHDINYFF